MIITMTHARFRAILICGFIAGCSAAALAVDTITGVARNQTRGRLAAGDEVILLRFDQRPQNSNLQEEARTKTDSQGSFTLQVRHPGALHLVRVIHQGVNYDQRASPGEAVSIDVFEAAANVQGVTGNIEIIRIGAKGNLLHVSDMIEIKNDSSPPLTQAGERTFEVYVPAHAKIDSVLAAGSGKIGAMISALPLPGEPEHFAVNVPLRPGSTKFAFNYDLPYDGHATFRTNSVYPLQQLAVMIPPTMKFTPRSPAFQTLRTGNDRYQVETANHVKAGEGPGFEVSGFGPLPAVRAQAEAAAKPPAAALHTPAGSASDSSRAQAAGDALDAVPASWFSAPSLRLQWWFLGAVGPLVLGPCGFLLWRKQRRSANARTTVAHYAKQPGRASGALVEAVKEELGRLEIDRLHGTISGEEYISAKQALEGTVKWASARAGLGGTADLPPRTRRSP